MRKHIARKTMTTLAWIALFLVLLTLITLFRVGEVFYVGVRIDKHIPAASVTELRTFGMDWEAPVVSIKNPKRTIDYKSTQFSIKSNEPLLLQESPKGWKLSLISSDPSSPDVLHYLLQTSDIENGSHKYKLVFVDQSANSRIQDIEIRAKKGRTKVPAWKNTEYYMPADSAIAIANKKYRLPEDFEPSDLVTLKSRNIHFANDAKIREVAIDDLKKMTRAISNSGIPYTVTSGYRSYSSQFVAYSFWLNYYSGDASQADTVSARPGHSEHQLGTTVDFTTSENNSVFFQFETTRLAKWLAKNAWKYGFVISYPAGKEEITGYTYEPWHYRYIGVENAKMERASKLTLTEWLLEQNSEFLGIQILDQ